MVALIFFYSEEISYLRITGNYKLQSLVSHKPRLIGDHYMSEELLTKPLKDLAIVVFEAIGFVTHHPMLLLKHPLADSRLSFVLTQMGSKCEYIGVIICDWKRIVGVNQVYKAKELLQTCPEINRILIVSSMGFSKSAKRIANKKEIVLIPRFELVSLIVKQLNLL